MMVFAPNNDWPYFAGFSIEIKSTDGLKKKVSQCIY